MNKTLKILKRIFTWAVVAIAIFMMIFTVISVMTFDEAKRSIFGYHAFIVKTDSMSATDFSAGDLVLVKDVKDPATLQEGDIITFQSVNPESYGEILTHKIRALTTTKDGQPGFITYGTTTNTDDAEPVTYSFVIGQYKTRLKGVGNFFRFLKTTPGYITCIFTPFLILILIQGVNSVQLFRKYRREQLAEMTEERERLEAERTESQRMMEELVKLREELAGRKQSDPPPAPATQAPTPSPKQKQAPEETPTATPTAAPAAAKTPARPRRAVKRDFSFGEKPSADPPKPEDGKEGQ